MAPDSESRGGLPTHDHIETTVLDVASRILSTDVTDLSRTLQQYGGDSLSLVLFTSEFVRDLHVELAAEAVASAGSLSNVAALIAERLRERREPTDMAP